MYCRVPLPSVVAVVLGMVSESEHTCPFLSPNALVEMGAVEGPRPSITGGALLQQG